MDNYEKRIPREAETTEIDLKRLLHAVLKRALWIILATVLCGAVALGATYALMTTKYQASAMFYVNNTSSQVNSQGISAADMSSSRSLVDSYIVILKANATMTEVIDYAGLDYSPAALSGMISAGAVDETEIFKVTVTCENPQDAEALANAIAHVIPERITSIIERSSVRLVDGAVAPSVPVAPNYASNTVLGALVGLLLSVGVVALIEIFDVTVKDKTDVQAACPYPILATVPVMSQAGKRSCCDRGYYSRNTGERKPAKKGNAVSTEDKLGREVGFAAAEAYNLLRTKLQYSFTDEQACRVIAISSAFAGEGKSVSCINLANSLAQLGKRVLLIDGDMRRPTQAEKLKLKKYPGLSEHLTGAADLNTTVQSCVLPGEGMAFHVLTAGNTPPNPIELLNSEKMKATVAALREKFDYIVMDLPPVGDVSDSLVAAKLADGVLLVVRQDYVTRPALRDAVQQFEFVGARILGALVNCTTDGAGSYGIKYGYRYGRRNRYDYRPYSQEKDEKAAKAGKAK